jgi:hypothetical protein
MMMAGIVPVMVMMSSRLRARRKYTCKQHCTRGNNSTHTVFLRVVSGKGSRCDQGRVISGDHFAAASTMGFRGTSGPTALNGRCVAGMWQRNAVITMRYAVMHGTFPCAIQSPKTDKCEEQSQVASIIVCAPYEICRRWARALNKPAQSLCAGHPPDDVTDIVRHQQRAIRPERDPARTRPCSRSRCFGSTSRAGRSPCRRESPEASRRVPNIVRARRCGRQAHNPA